MRTTVRLDPDLAERLKRIARERRVSFREALNTALRRGLAPRSPRGEPYRIPARRLGLRPGVDLDRALALAAAMEDEERRSDLELRK